VKRNGVEWIALGVWESTVLIVVVYMLRVHDWRFGAHDQSARLVILLRATLFGMNNDTCIYATHYAAKYFVLRGGIALGVASAIALGITHMLPTLETYVVQLTNATSLGRTITPAFAQMTSLTTYLTNWAIPLTWSMMSSLTFMALRLICSRHFQGALLAGTGILGTRLATQAAQRTIEECCRSIENTFIIQYPNLSMKEKISQLDMSRSQIEREAAAESHRFRASVNPKLDRMQQLIDWVKKNSPYPLLDSFSHEIEAIVLLLGSINHNTARALSIAESCQERERAHFLADREQNTDISKAQLHLAESGTKAAKTNLERLRATARNCRKFLEFIRLNLDRIEKMHSRNSGIEQLDWWTFSASTIDLVLKADGRYL
jgi:hypothetical protein